MRIVRVRTVRSTEREDEQRVDPSLEVKTSNGEGSSSTSAESASTREVAATQYNEQTRMCHARSRAKFLLSKT